MAGNAADAPTPANAAPPPVLVDSCAPITLATRADEGGRGADLNFYELPDNLPRPTRPRVFWWLTQTSSSGRDPVVDVTAPSVEDNDQRVDLERRQAASP